MVKAAWSGSADVYQSEMAPAAIQNIVESNGRGFFRDTNQALLEALAAAIEDGRRTQGSNLARWDYGR